MKREWLAYGLFGLGAFFLAIHTVVPALWTLFGLAGPPPLTGESGVLYFLPGFSPPLGAVAMLLAGLAYTKGGEA